jgi:hypothetical protein
MESAQACRIRRPVAGPPVNVTFFTSGCDTRASPASGAPGRILITPAGKPASATRSANSSPVNGVSSDGFTMTVLPAATAGGTLWASEMSGPFQVMMIPMTP